LFQVAFPFVNNIHLVNADAGQAYVPDGERFKVIASRSTKVLSVFIARLQNLSSNFQSIVLVLAAYIKLDKKKILRSILENF
jgi:hypothetical protein